MAPSKRVARQKSPIRVITFSSAFLMAAIFYNYQRTARRRRQLSLKKLKAEMEELKAGMKEIRADVDMICQGQKHLKGQRLGREGKTGMGKPMYSRLHPATGELDEIIMAGTKQACAKNRLRLDVKKFNKQLKKKMKSLQRMGAKVAKERVKTSNVRKETAEMVEEIEKKEAELELLRMLHNQLFDEMLHTSEAEERLMEIILS